MRPLPDVCVLDASALIRAFIEMDHSRAARSMLRSLIELDRAVVAPDLLYVECANVIWKYVRLRGLARRSAEQYMREIIELSFRVVPSANTAIDAIRLALSTGVSAYDASYAIVADQFGATLVTGDTKLVQKLAETKIAVAHISEFEAG